VGDIHNYITCKLIPQVVLSYLKSGESTALATIVSILGNDFGIISTIFGEVK
jgi:hypothetical protein